MSNAKVKSSKSNKDHSGVMECWKDGIMRKRKDSFFSNPIFQCSIIPFFHVLLSLDIHLTFACLREVPPCGTEAGILRFGFRLLDIILKN